MRVYAWHDKSGCGWYRIRLPLTALAGRGHEVKLVLGSDVDTEDAHGYQVIVAQRMDKQEALPEWRRLIRPPRPRLVYEIDDDVFSVDVVNQLAWGTYSRSEVRDAVMHAAETADVVTVTCEPLAEVMRRCNPNVAVLPNCVPDDLLEHERPRRPRVVVGWAGGASHALDMVSVAAPLRRFLDRNRHVELHLIGTDYRPTIGRQARHTLWSEDVWKYYRAIDYDIGICPLVDTPFARSKSAIKALECAALGIPVVASNVGPYQRFVVEGVTGYLVDHDHQWSKRLYELANDAPMRAEMGAAAREHARSWAISRHAHRWEAAYEGIMKS